MVEVWLIEDKRIAEIWKDIEGYKGLYQISNLGRVKSLSRLDALGHKLNEKILKISKNNNGYYFVGLCKNGKVKQYLIHRLVAEAFVKNPYNYSEVNHKDENKQNNIADNLEWCTHEYNCKYGTRNKRTGEKIKGKCLGDKNGNSTKVKCKTTGEVFTTMKEAGQKYNISYNSISNCCSGKSKSAGKHPITGEKLIWEYI